MNNGFVKVAAATPKIKVGDCGYNGAQICKIIDEVYDNGAQLVVFPELCITGYTCSGLLQSIAKIRRLWQLLDCQ